MRLEQIVRRLAGSADSGVAVVVEAAVESVLVDEVVGADGPLDAFAVGDASDVAGGSAFVEEQGRLRFGRVVDEKRVEHDAAVAGGDELGDLGGPVDAEHVVAAVLHEIVPVAVAQHVLQQVVELFADGVVLEHERVVPVALSEARVVGAADSVVDRRVVAQLVKLDPDPVEGAVGDGGGGLPSVGAEVDGYGFHLVMCTV